ncbi:MAG: hypothetical protein J6A57_04065 [Ruminococcus sp.]|nr:hypothetical protein [Ruminococcus sp.]
MQKILHKKSIKDTRIPAAGIFSFYTATGQENKTAGSYIHQNFSHFEHSMIDNQYKANLTPIQYTLKFEKSQI